MLNRLQSFATQRIGPLVAWQWFMIVTVLAVLLLYFRNRKAAEPATVSKTDNMVRDPVTGEFKSAQSNETVDPVTGERRTSSYEASGNLGGLVYPGNIGFAAYPAPYSGGDVYVNLPGDQRNLNPGTPVTRYPPKEAPRSPDVGGYWWTPRTAEDAAALASRAGLWPDYDAELKLNPSEFKLLNLMNNRMMIMAANPQVNWGSGNFTTLIGVPLYIPQAAGDWQKDDKNLPVGASFTAPAGYNPPVQQTTVSQPA